MTKDFDEANPFERPASNRPELEEGQARPAMTPDLVARGIPLFAKNGVLSEIDDLSL